MHCEDDERVLNVVDIAALAAFNRKLLHFRHFDSPWREKDVRQTTEAEIQSIERSGDPLLMTDVVDRPSPHMIQILRSTLQKLERSREYALDDPALQEFKRSILRLIADLQLRKEHRPDVARVQPEEVDRSVVTLIVRPGKKHDQSPE
jgi:hypothetical protein